MKQVVMATGPEEFPGTLDTLRNAFPNAKTVIRTSVSIIMAHRGNHRYSSGMNASKPIQHPSSNSQHPPAFEYVFPVSRNELLPEHLPLFDDWMSSLIERSESEVAHVVSECWNTICHPGVHRFAQRLLKRQPHSIFLLGDKVWLLLRHPDEPDNIVRVRSPRPLTENERALAESFDVPGLTEFLTFFRDLRESRYDCSNWIWDEISTVSAKDDELGDIGDWDGSLSLAYKCSGDLVFLRRGGSTAFWLHEFGWSSDASEEDIMWPLAPDFDTFLDLYSIHLEATHSGREESCFY